MCVTANRYRTLQNYTESRCYTGKLKVLCLTKHQCYGSYINFLCALFFIYLFYKLFVIGYFFNIFRILLKTQKNFFTKINFQKFK